MKGLILKDLLNLKKSLKTFIFVIVFYIMFSAYFNNSNFLSGTIIIMFSIMTVSSFSYDNIAKWDRYALSLPLSKKDLVLSKYILSILMIAFGAVLSVLLNFVFSIYKGTVSALNEQLLSSFSIIFVAVIYICVLLPLIYKFGVEKSRILIFAVFVIPTFVVVLLGKLGLSLLPQDNLELILKISPLISIVVYYISYKLSYKIYYNKEV